MRLETVVALEASSRQATIAVRAGERRASSSLEPDKAHATDLLPILAELLAQVDLGPDAIDAVAVGTGPGSFTGLRVGIATALGLCRGTGAALIGVPSFETLAYGQLEAGERATIVTNAHGGQLYVAQYERTADEVETLSAPRIEAAREWRLGEFARDTVLLTEEKLLEALAIDRGAQACRTEWTTEASALLELGCARLAHGRAMALDEVQPLYLRPFAARKPSR